MSKKRKNNYPKQRLLTKAEKEVIITSFNNSKKNISSAAIVILLVFLIQGILFKLLGSSIKEIGFIILNEIVIFSIFVGAYIIRFKAVIKKVKVGSMYCVEAEYIETSGKYHITYLRGYKSPSVEGYDLTKREPLEKGDRVIVLVMRYPAWVYKARE